VRPAERGRAHHDADVSRAARRAPARARARRPHAALAVAARGADPPHPLRLLRWRVAHARTDGRALRHHARARAADRGARARQAASRDRAPAHGRQRGNASALMIDTAAVLKRYIRDVPDFPKKGILFKDIAPLLRSPDGFRAAIEGLAGSDDAPDAVVAVESRGFIFGAGLALHW